MLKLKAQLESICSELKFQALDAGASRFSVGSPGRFYLLEIEGLFTQGPRPGRTSGELVGGIFDTDSAD
jgi:hypothetical protein